MGTKKESDKRKFEREPLEIVPKDQLRLMAEVKKLPLNEAVIIVFALETGVRISELLSIRIGDVKGRDSFFVRTLKQKKGLWTYREIPISDRLKVYLDPYLAALDSINSPVFNPEGFLFISRRRTPVSARYIQHFFLNLMIKLELTHQERASNKKMRYHGPHFHSLRHSFAMNLMRKGVRLEVIQKLLGHKNLSSTGVYLNPTREDLFEAVA